jgi:hypothetical protein
MSNINIVGTFVISFSSIRTFDNGGGLVTYLVYHENDKGNKRRYTIKEFFKDVQPPNRANGTTWIVMGDLIPDIYKDRTTDEWIDKGDAIHATEWHQAGDISDIIEKQRQRDNIV